MNKPLPVIKTDSIRECRMFIRCLIKAYNIPWGDSSRIILENYPSLTECCSAINSFIHNRLDRNIADDFNKLIEINKSEYMLHDQDIAWLKASERATFWMWGQFVFERELYSRIKQGSWTTSLPIDLIPKAPPKQKNHQQRYDYIIDIIDDISFDSCKNTARVREFILTSQNKWLKKQHITINELDRNNHKLCLFAYQYIKNKQHEEKELVRKDTPFFPVCLQEPQNSEEMYLSVYAMLDLWDVNYNKLEQTVQNMVKTKDWKAIIRDWAETNVIKGISHACILQLNELSSRQQQTQHEIIENLISRQYKESILKQ